MTNTSVGYKWATTQYIDDYSVKINNQCVNYSSICRNFEIAAKIANFLHKCLFRLPNLHCSRFQATSNRVIPHGVGKCHEVTKVTGSRQELAVSNANRLRDYSGSLVKGDSPRRGEMSKGSLVKGDSPRCGEMSRSDKGDGLPSGAVYERSE